MQKTLSLGNSEWLTVEDATVTELADALLITDPDPGSERAYFRLRAQTAVGNAE